MSLAQALKEQLRRWLDGWLSKPAPRAELPARDWPYPDYVPCPHCDEPEVEVWCNEPTALCHNCGQTFAHPVPPDCLPPNSDRP